MSSAWPVWFNCWFSLALAHSGCKISLEYSFLFIIVVHLTVDVYALMHRLSWEPLCKPIFFKLCGKFYEEIYIKSCRAFCSCVFKSFFTIAITSLSEVRSGLYAFVRLFVRRVMVCVSFLFLLVSGIGCDL